MKELIEKQKPNLLEKTRTYLVGHMQYLVEETGVNT